MTPTITAAELSQHNTKGDCWLAIKGRVYDVTKFVPEHPGGSGLLEELGGQDATEDFLGMHPEGYLSQFIGEPVALLGEKEEEADEEKEKEKEEKQEEKVEERSSPEVPPTRPSEVTEPQPPSEPPQPTAPVSPTADDHHVTSNLLLLTRTRGAPGGGFGPLSILTTRDTFYARRKRGFARRRATSGAFTFNLKLTAKENITHNTMRLTFSTTTPLRLDPGQHLYLKGNGVMRPYTPTDVREDGHVVELVVKVYDKGVMTQHLSKAEVGDAVGGEVKDFHKFRYFNNGSYDAGGEELWCANIAMVAGGTGITPMYSLIKHMLSDPFDTTRIWLLYANQSPFDILLRHELDTLAAQHPHRFHVHYTVDTPPTAPWPYSTGYINATHLAFLPTTQSTVTLICGPPPMTRSVSKCLNSLGKVIPL